MAGQQILPGTGPENEPLCHVRCPSAAYRWISPVLHELQSLVCIRHDEG